MSSQQKTHSEYLEQIKKNPNHFDYFDIPEEYKTLELCLLVLERGDPISFLESIKNQREEIIWACLKKEVKSFYSINNPTTKMILYALVNNIDEDANHEEGGFLLGSSNLEKYNQTQEICDASVAANPESFCLVNPEFQTENMCLLAVTSCPSLIEYVNTQTANICLIALSNVTGEDDYDDEVTKVFSHCKFQTPEVIEKAMSLSKKCIKYIVNQSPYYQAMALTDPFNIENIYNPTEYQKWQVLLSCPGSLEYIKGQTREMCFYAVSHSQQELILEYCEVQDEEICLVSCTQNGDNVQFVKYVEDLTEAVKFAAIRSKPPSIRFIENPSYELLKEVVSIDGTTIYFIPEENQTVELCQIAYKQNPICLKDCKYKNMGPTSAMSPRLILKINSPTSR